MQSLSTNAGEFDSARGIQPKTNNSQSIILLKPILGQPWNKSRTHRHLLRDSACVEVNSTMIRVITKLPNSEQSYKGKVKTHKYINRQNQSTTENCENRNDPDLVQAFLKKLWVESDCYFFRIGPKKVILRQGHTAESFYFILSGTG
jgi:hypothetical protein